MKKLLSGSATLLALFSLTLQVSATATQSELQTTYATMKPALTILTVILAALALFSILLTVLVIRPTEKRGRPNGIVLAVSYIATVTVLVLSVLCWNQYRQVGSTLDSMNATATQPSQTDPSLEPGTEPSSDPSTEPSTEPPTEPEPTYEPGYVDVSDPKNWGVKWEIIAHGAIVSNYQREEPISFGNPDDYFVFPGIATFRGSNYRNGATYGTATVVNKTLTSKWKKQVGSLNGWPGCGWTGQPLMVRWDQETKNIMNLYNEKKGKDGLVEVIYATLDGYIYFYDLDDGSYTRDPIWVGMNFKGAGALDPRGYPLMYVGSGDYVNGKAPRMYIISLIDGSILFERSGNDAFSLRDWVAFDSSPLVDAETDTLIWPGESGILYTIKLNSDYDQAAGTISISPEEIVKTRYTTALSNSGSYWLGYECSAVIVDRFLYLSENGGMFYCVDLNTMELVWAQDTKDDSNSSPLFQWDKDGTTGYLYTAPSIHWTKNANAQGIMTIYKLNAKTGEIVWTKSYNCHTVDGVSGGVQSSPLLGKPGTDIENMIFYSVARTPHQSDGCLVALDTETGDVIWELYMDNYTWSSPVAIYTEEGKSYVAICDSVGIVRLLDGVTGEVLSSIGLGSNVEASPAVFENTIVVGTRGQLVCAIKID